MRGWRGAWALAWWSCAAGHAAAAEEDGFTAVAEMLTGMGGSVDSRVGVGMTSYGVRGLIARAAIPARTTFLHVPSDAMLARPGPDPDSCVQIAEIVAELRKREQSAWWPYLRFDGSLGANVPATWTDAELVELQRLPPYDSRRHVEWYTSTCRPGTVYAQLEDVEKQALWIQITRAADVGLMAIYDLANHNNGELNTYLQHSDKTGLDMVTRVDIPAGGEIFNTYGHHETSDIFRDYGFVEPWPHVWSFEDADGKVHRFVVMQADGPVLLHHVHSEFDLAPGNSLLQEKVAATWSLLDKTRDEELRSSLEAAEWMLDAQPTTAEEDELLAEGASGNVLRAIRYRIAVKNDLATIATFLEARVRSEGDFRWPHSAPEEHEEL